MLAAGMSKRMGCPKMVLPWGSTTVIGRVVSVLESTGIDPIIVVVGGAEDLVRLALTGTSAMIVTNPNYENGEMLESLKCGLRSLPDSADSTLIVLGDQPQIEEDVVRKIVSSYHENGPLLIVPSFQKHRGHPWLIDHRLFYDLVNLEPSKNMRYFLNSHAQIIEYVDIDQPTILMDLDTPDDYQASHPLNH